MKQGDFVKIDYVGSIKGTDTIFDLTKADVAKEKGIFNPDGNYSPVVLILGSGFVIGGLDEELQKMEVGEKKKIEIPPEKAFGEKKEDMIRLIPESVFKDQNLNVSPGSVVSIGDMKGKILSVDGGRIRVDFNHPLAGKTIAYDIEVLELVKELDEQIQSVVDYFTRIGNSEIKTTGKEADIIIKKDVDVIRPVKTLIAQTVMKWCDIEKVKWTEVFEKRETEKDEHETTGK